MIEYRDLTPERVRLQTQTLSVTFYIQIQLSRLSNVSRYSGVTVSTERNTVCSRDIVCMYALSRRAEVQLQVRMLCSELSIIHTGHISRSILLVSVLLLRGTGTAHRFSVCIHVSSQRQVQMMSVLIRYFDFMNPRYRDSYRRSEHKNSLQQGHANNLSVNKNNCIMG